MTPRLKGGTRMAAVLLHQVCHSAIHARFTEAGLANRLATAEALLARGLILDDLPGSDRVVLPPALQPSASVRVHNGFTVGVGVLEAPAFDGEHHRNRKRMVAV